MEIRRETSEQLQSLRYSLQVDISTDQSVVEQEDLSLLRLENLPFFTINYFSQQFTLDQLPLL